MPRAGQGKRGESGYLGYLLRQAALAFRRRMDDALEELGVTPPQFSVLTMIAAYPGLSNADLARLALLTPQTVSVIVGNLERMGAIERRPHAVHRRIQRLDLTDHGRSLLQACRLRAHAVDQELGAGLSDEQAQVVRRWLVEVAVDCEPRPDEGRPSRG